MHLHVTVIGPFQDFDIWSFELLCKLNCNLSFNMLLDIAVYSIKDIFELNCNNIFFLNLYHASFIHCFIKNNYMSNGKKMLSFLWERERENCPNTRYCNTVISVHPCRSSVLNRILLIFKRMLYPVIHMSLLSWKKEWASSHNPTLPITWHCYTYC